MDEKDNNNDEIIKMLLNSILEILRNNMDEKDNNNDEKYKEAAKYYISNIEKATFESGVDIERLSKEVADKVLKYIKDNKKTKSEIVEPPIVNSPLQNENLTPKQIKQKIKNYFIKSSVVLVIVALFYVCGVVLLSKDTQYFGYYSTLPTIGNISIITGLMLLIIFFAGGFEKKQFFLTILRIARLKDIRTNYIEVKDETNKTNYEIATEKINTLLSKFLYVLVNVIIVTIVCIILYNTSVKTHNSTLYLDTRDKDKSFNFIGQSIAILAYLTFVGADIVGIVFVSILGFSILFGKGFKKIELPTNELP